jgi:hypothetical protein
MSFTFAANILWKISHFLVIPCESYQNASSANNINTLIWRGGKVAMSVALSPELHKSLLSHLIIADIAPSRGPLSPEFRNYFKAMCEIESQGIKTRKEAHDILQPYESVRKSEIFLRCSHWEWLMLQDAMIRAFILTNLLPPNAEGEGMKFRIPLDVLVPALSDLGDFPYEPSQRHWHGPTLVIKGSKSK